MHIYVMEYEVIKIRFLLFRVVFITRFCHDLKSHLFSVKADFSVNKSINYDKDGLPREKR